MTFMQSHPSRRGETQTHIPWMNICTSLFVRLEKAPLVSYFIFIYILHIHRSIPVHAYTDTRIDVHSRRKKSLGRQLAPPENFFPLLSFPLSCFPASPSFALFRFSSPSTTLTFWIQSVFTPLAGWRVAIGIRYTLHPQRNTKHPPSLCHIVRVDIQGACAAGISSTPSSFLLSFLLLSYIVSIYHCFTHQPLI